MGYRTVWIDEGECKSCLNYGPGRDSILNDRVKRDRDYENTGFCMIYWHNCTCLDCGRKWEEQ